MQCHDRASFGRLQNSQPAASEEARTEQDFSRSHLAQVADWVQRKGGELAVATPSPSDGSGAGRVVQLRSRHPYFIVPKAALKPLKFRS